MILPRGRRRRRAPRRDRGAGRYTRFLSARKPLHPSWGRRLSPQCSIARPPSLPTPGGAG